MGEAEVRTHQFTVTVNEADCLSNVVQAHGHILLPAFQRNSCLLAGVYASLTSRVCHICQVSMAHLAGPVMSSV